MTEWIITSSVLVVVVIVLRTVLKGKISLRLQYALWALVLVRLLIPGSLVSSAISVMNVLPEQPALSVVAPPAASAAPVMTVPPVEATVPVSPVESAPAITLPPMESAPVTPPAPTPVVPETPTAIPWASILRGVWIFGMAAMALWFIIGNLRFYLRLTRCREVLKYESPTLYVVQGIETPCLFGLLNPSVYVTPEVAADKGALAHVLAHEETHYHHKDHIWSLLRCICLVVHWYNPLVWLAAALSRRDSELACDEGAIRRLGEEQRAAYGRTLIGLTCTGVGGLLRTATTMTGSKKSIKERIVLIAKKPKMKLYTLVAVILIAVIAAGCTFTGKAGVSVDDINDQKGYTITAQSRHPYTIVIPKEKLPDSIYTAEGHTFEENEVVVYETETTTVWLESAQLSNESEQQLYFKFDFSYRDLPENGSILRMYRVNEGGTASSTSDLSWLAVKDNAGGYYLRAVTLRGSGPGESITYYVSTEVCRQAEGFLSFESWCYEIEYKKGQHEFGPYVPEIAEEKSDEQQIEDCARQMVTEHAAQLKAELGREVHAGNISGAELWRANAAVGPDYHVDVYKVEYFLLHNLTSGEEAGIIYGGVVRYDRYMFLLHQGGEPILLGHMNGITVSDVYGTPEMLDQYSDMYTAAAMVLYQSYLREQSAMPIDPDPDAIPEHPAAALIQLTQRGGNLTLGLYTREEGQRGFYPLKAYLVDGIVSCLTSYQWTAQTQAPGNDWDSELVLTAGEGSPRLVICSGEITAVRYERAETVLWWIPEENGQGERFDPSTIRQDIYDELEYGAELVFEADSPLNAVMKFVREVFNNHIRLNLTPGNVYRIRHYEVKSWSIDEVSVDGNAVVGTFAYAFVPEGDILHFASGNLEEGTGDYAGWWIKSGQFLLERKADGLWHCNGISTGGVVLELSGYEPADYALTRGDAAAAAAEIAAGMEYVQCCAVFDLNHDGQDEIILETGTYEQDRIYHFFAFINGVPVKIGEEYGTHSHLASDGTDLIIAAGHMSVENAYRITWEGGAFRSEQIICNRYVGEAGYTEWPGELEELTCQVIGHRYYAEVTKAPTCTAKGLKTYTCTCGDSYTEDIRAVGHSYSGKVTTAPTCTKDGVKVFTCTCGDSYTEAVKAEGHHWTGNPCTGTVCTACGASEGEGPGHDWAIAGALYAHCNRCGMDYTPVINMTVRQDDLDEVYSGEKTQGFYRVNGVGVNVHRIKEIKNGKIIVEGNLVLYGYFEGTYGEQEAFRVSVWRGTEDISIESMLDGSASDRSVGAKHIIIPEMTGSGAFAVEATLGIIIGNPSSPVGPGQHAQKEYMTFTVGEEYMAWVGLLVPGT